MRAPEKVLEALERQFDRSLRELCDLARIPGVSASGFDPAPLARSAEFVAQLLEQAGLERVEVLRVSGAHPYVVAEWSGAGADAPTVLLYAHHDVQPPGRESRWQSPAFEPTLRADGRLYGRGVVDDKAGVIVQLGALRAWLDAEGALPVNVRAIVEGEEEIGSPHLAAFLGEHRERLRADVIVLSDTANLETGLPSLTTSLRGLVNLNLRVRALDHPIHSGMWGGPVLDAATALARILARLVDDRGVCSVPGLDADVRPLGAEERARLARLPFHEARFREEAGMLAGSRFAGDESRSVYERLWARPSVAVTALESVPLARAANQLIDEARARVGVRLAPEQSPERARECVAAWLAREAPCGVEVEVETADLARGWRSEPSGPAFDAAREALALGYGREPVAIGCGGTIPFVAPFAEVMGDAPALLLGLEDPVCNAHGENESLHIEDFRCAARSLAHLFPALRAHLGG
jgi:acetylornithine deacetylase/succinyl-diaminopimelate desuccinylase-like protein